MDTGVIKYSIWENVDLTYFFMFFSHYSETICFREYSTSAAAFNTANHWPLPLKDFLGNGKEYEWEGERGRRREEKKADVTDFLTRGKNRNIMLWDFFFFSWGEAKILEFHLIHKWFQLWPTKPASTKSCWQKQTGVDFPAEENLLITEGDVSVREKKALLNTKKMDYS